MSDDESHNSLRVLFVGRDNPFNRGVAKWAEDNFHLVACFFNEDDRFSIRSRWKVILRRIKRYGILRTLDQLLFQVFWKIMKMVFRENEHWIKKVPHEFVQSVELKTPTYCIDDVHSKESIELCKNLKPDVIIGSCGSVIYKKHFYRIPTYGTFIIHEGITPEYRGLHTSLWAMLKNETQYVGVTVLKIDNSIDGGSILFQKRYELSDDEGWKCWSFVGHKAIIDALPDIKNAFDNLYREKSFKPVDTTGRTDGLYTWMGFSQFIRLRMSQVLSRRNQG